MLEYALLGLLAREACSGYDLARLMQQRVNNFWHARHSQIYPTLAQLEAQGLVRHERVEQEDRPDKKLFSITEEGRVALQKWVESPSPLAPRRDELLLKAYSIWLADPQAGAALFRHHAGLHREQLAHFEEKLAYVEQKRARGEGEGGPLFGALAVLRCGISQERAYVEWCDWMTGELEQAVD